MTKKKEEAGIALLYATRILLVYQRASRLWGIPKGMIKDHEDLFACALREFYEETGLVISGYDHYIGKIKFGNITCFIFETLEKYIPKPIHTDEIITASWKKIDDVKFLPHNSSIRDWFSVDEIRESKSINKNVITVKMDVSETGNVNCILCLF